ncbi:acyl-CoA dehydrogenase family protein [Streptomyces sp. NPDC006355]|uniref:acyl-CoA dehydrogenase family protein n=1 Tax=Streptomyces sp. NPDC006355 TaxID=3156758 RepID=UPI0033A354A4
MAVAAATAVDRAVADAAGAPVRPATPSAADADRRAARLEMLLGDPYAPDNPHGLTALFDADARRRPPEPTKLVLEQFGLSAECVPVANGGRLTRADLLARVLRPVFRRDVALGIAMGTDPLLAAAPVWAAGSTLRRAHTAVLLLGGDRIGLVPHGRTAGTAPGGITARPAADGGLLLDGRAEAAPGAGRARLYVVQVRTGPARSPHSHTAVLLDGDRLATPAVPKTGRAAHCGPLHTPRAEIELHGHAVPYDAVLAGVGEGVPLALRAQQVGHALVPALLVAAADTALRSAVRAAADGGTSPARWHRRLAGVFADALACDSFAGVALRALSLLPAQAQVPAAAVHYLVPALLRENLEELACVLGARRHDRAGAHYGTLGRLMRALPLAAAGLAGTGAADGRAVIAPHLRPLAEHCWFAEPEPPSALFRGGADLPDLHFASLAAAGRGDFLAASLSGSAARLAGVRGVGGHMAVLAELSQDLVTELHALRARCRALPIPGTGPLPVASVCALVDRYALLLAAAAVLGVWEGQDGADPFLAAPAWPVLALSRIARRLGAPVPPLPDGVVELVHRELVRRCHERLSCDLDATELAP